MPAARTRDRRADDGQLTWAPVLEPKPPTTIAFATNITPGTFNDPPSPSLEEPAESLLFPPSDTPSTPKKAAHSKKKAPDHIPRPPNAFILFRSSFIKSQHVRSEVETNHSTLSKIIGITWQNLPADERRIWQAKARAALDEHKRKWPSYAFRPLHPKHKGREPDSPSADGRKPTAPKEKRKVKEIGQKDLTRCAKIAELLVEGKKGEELNAAMAEFDKHHVPPTIVPRFEEPLTVRAYRRSSSAPIPETEHVRKSQSFRPSTPARSSARKRSSSSEPEPANPRDDQHEIDPSMPPLVDNPHPWCYDVPQFSLPWAPSQGMQLCEFAADPHPSFSFEHYTVNQSLSTSSSPAGPSYASMPPCDPLAPLTPEVHGSMNMHRARPGDDSSDYGQGSTTLYTPRPLAINTSFLDYRDYRHPSPYSSTPGSPGAFSPGTPLSYDAPGTPSSFVLSPPASGAMLTGFLGCDTLQTTPVDGAFDHNALRNPCPSVSGDSVIGGDDPSPSSPDPSESEYGHMFGVFELRTSSHYPPAKVDFSRYDLDPQLQAILDGKPSTLAHLDSALSSFISGASSLPL
ncbi:hypothetical protein PUNSTDRAFT_143817 [Punctularia strigosozonata HHB-11173 SS5]|uniref:uncharacterized protein n=1 Tax=Punctularia strigosozonata (strain HHB-11173) TaxID=741275 RepID=UPI00044162C2|nr:uncharacterized protein PUNSTDRAFT_143817 [Punctularia strigosozonata HHB-11173 SS5]EIN08125.1 hypothetical protein PUNSTDRAFT_143817 [Punctularia strigosozonata HHB-11173 SS5]